MKYRAILTAFYNTPWAILPAKLAEIDAFLRLQAGGKKVKKAEIEALAGKNRPMNVDMVGRVAVVPVFGTIMQRAGLIEQASGGIGTEALGATIDSLVADKQVKCIVLAFDSPGGSVFGVQELGDKIRGARGDKKIVSLADSMAASAAYWLASQASEVYCTPGGQVGSIGVLCAHLDASKMEEMVGVKTTLVSAGKYKTELADNLPLSDEARAELQSKVDAYYASFIDAVAKGRNTTPTKVKNDMGQGRMMTAQQAKEAGMIDGIRTLQVVLDRLGAYESTGARADAPAPALSAGMAAARARAVEVSQNANHESTKE